MPDSISLNNQVNTLQSRLSSVSNHRVLALMTFLWSMPTILTLINADPARITIATLLAGFISFVLMLIRPVNVLLGLPFFVLISPAGGFIQLLGKKGVLTDWLMIGLIVVSAFSYLAEITSQKLKLNKNDSGHYMVPLGVIFVFGCTMGFASGNITNFKIIYYLLSYSAIYYYFSRFALTEKQWESILYSWMLAACLGVAIMLQAFYAGTPLINFAEKPDEIVDRATIEWVFRASYYYNGFHYILGILITGLGLSIVFRKEIIIRKIFPCSMLFILIMALATMANKTAIFSVILSFFGMYVMLGYRLKRLKLIYVLPLAGMVFFGFFVFLSKYGTELYQSKEQYINFILQPASLFVRLEMWIHSVQVLCENPGYLILGVGPNVIEMGDQQVAELFKRNPSTGVNQGALDSFWFTYFVEMGICGSVVLIALLGRILETLNECRKKMSNAAITAPTFLMAVGGIAYLAFASTSQSLGYSKISWLPFQLILIVFAYGRCNPKARAVCADYRPKIK